MIDDAILGAAILARKFEGCYLRPYLCPAGVPTIGYGSTFYENGTHVTLGDPAITRERAEQLLAYELRRVCLPAVLRYCPNLDTAERVAAIIDFVFNLGTGSLKVSTLRRRLNGQQWDAACAELAKWNKGGGRVLPGLVKRRAVEAGLVGGGN